MPIVRKVPPPLVPDPIPQKFTREQAIERLLAHGLTLAEIQAEEEQVAAMHAVALLREACSTAAALNSALCRRARFLFATRFSVA